MTPILHRSTAGAVVAGLVVCLALPADAQTAKRAVRKAVPAAAAAPPPLAPADSDQLAAAAMAHVGDYACEFDQTVQVSSHGSAEGYVDVRHRKDRWTMKPVLSNTGALRLEDVGGRMLMLQIANKSMLMDTKVGRRLVDNCVHEKQRNVALPAPGESLGIDPEKALAAAAYAAAAAAASAAAAAASGAPTATATTTTTTVTTTTTTTTATATATAAPAASAPAVPATVPAAPARSGGS